MIEFQVKELIKARGVKSATKQLVKAGIAHGTVAGYMTNSRDSMKREHIEIFCKLLRCTPNDLFAWTPDQKADDYPENTLQAIRKKPTINIEEKLKGMTLEEIRKKFEE